MRTLLFFSFFISYHSSCIHYLSPLLRFFDKACQNPVRFLELCMESLRESGIFQVTEIFCYKKLAFYLEQRSFGYPEKMNSVFSARSPVTLRNVRRYRDRRSPYLTGKRKKLFFRECPADSIHEKYEFVRLLPGEQILKSFYLFFHLLSIISYPASLTLPALSRRG